jgi:hypothetical protein
MAYAGAWRFVGFTGSRACDAKVCTFNPSHAHVMAWKIRVMLIRNPWFPLPRLDHAIPEGRHYVCSSNASRSLSERAVETLKHRAYELGLVR